MGEKMWCIRCPDGSLCCLADTEDNAWKVSAIPGRADDDEEQIAFLKSAGFKAVRVTVTIDEEEEAKKENG